MLEGVGITVGSCFQNNDPGREDTLHLCPKPAQRRPATLMLQTRSLLFLLQYSPQNLIIAWAIYIYIYMDVHAITQLDMLQHSQTSRQIKRAHRKHLKANHNTRRRMPMPYESQIIRFIIQPSILFVSKWHAF